MRPVVYRAAMAAKALPLFVAMPALAGCTVVTVASTAVSVTASAVGLVADATVGTVRVMGKGVGMAADAVSSNPAPDNSGIQVRESIRPAH